MSKSNRLQWIWKTLCGISHPFFEHKFRFQHDNYTLSGPSLIIANHVTSWDPLLLAIAFPKNHLHFVASEHMFRWGMLSKLISWLVEPIARRKGASGTESAMTCLRKIREGRSVCIFGEGEVTWDGRSHEVFPGTGMLAKASGASLITFRFDGGCLTAPRWAKKKRKGKMMGKIVNIYSPETLKTMSTEAVAEAINRDIYLDAFEEQEKHPIPYRGKRLAENLESALFLCPQCHRINTLHSKGNYLTCDCGLNLKYTDYAVFSPAEPFRNVQQWDDWQHDCLRKNDFIHQDILFSDENVTLYHILSEQKKQKGEIISISLDQDGCFRCGDHTFPFSDISHMAMVQANKLFFTMKDEYYQLKAEKQIVNFRKYLAAWNIYNDERKDENGLFCR